MYVKHLATDMKLHRARQVLSHIAVLQGEFLADGADRPPPAEISQLVGAALHTARSALDDLAVSLVIASRRTPRLTSFPIAGSAHDFPEELSRGLRRANQKARDAVASVMPWKGADDKLWDLHQLGAVEHPITLRLGRPVTRLPVRVPTALQVLQAATPATEPSPLLADLRLLMGEGDMVRGHSVLESLDMLITHAAVVVERVVSTAERH